MAQGLRVLAALAEDLDLVPSTSGGLQPPANQVQGIQYPLLAFVGIPMYIGHIYMPRYTIQTQKVNNLKYTYTSKFLNT